MPPLCAMLRLPKPHAEPLDAFPVVPAVSSANPRLNPSPRTAKTLNSGSPAAAMPTTDDPVPPPAARVACAIGSGSDLLRAVRSRSKGPDPISPKSNKSILVNLGIFSK